MPDAFTDKKMNGHPVKNSLGLAHVNHYSLRSMEAFLVKIDRGDAVNPDNFGLGDSVIGRALTYWKKRNRGADSNDDRRSVRPKHFEAVHKELLLDPTLGQLQAKALERHAEKLDDLLKTEGGRSLAENIGYFA
jgi:hypothetical protein